MSDKGGREDLRRGWEATEERIAKLVTQLGERIPAQDRRNVAEFSEHREYGLAFEQIVLTLLDEGVQLREDEFSEIASIYQDFRSGLTEIDDDRIARLRKLATS